MKRSTKKTALAGMLAALAVVVMLTGLFDSMELSAAMLGGLVVLVAMIELGMGYSFGVYASAGVISLLFVPSVGLVFLCFGGIYPIAKYFIEKLRIRPLRWIIKFLLFAVFTVAYVKLGMLPEEMTWYIYPVSLLALVLYDVTLAAFSVFYTKKFKNIIKR